MDIIPHLLSFVAVNVVFAAGDVDLHQVAEEAVQLFQFFKRNRVGCVAVDLVGGHVYKDRFRNESTGGFEQVERSGRVNIEIIKWSLGGEVMTRLGG